MAAIMSLNTMAQNNNTNATDDVKPTILHDFLGRGCPPVAKFATATDLAASSSPSASVSGGAARPVSTTSDLGSVGTLYEGVPFFGHKSDLISGSKIRYSGNKRSHSDSGFMPAIPQLQPNFPEASHSHLMKMLRNVGARWPQEDEPLMRPTSHMAQQANASKWERAIPVNVGPVVQYPAPRAAPYAYQPVSNRFKDSNTLISQLAADEGSRTGIKGSGILEPSSSKLKSLISNSEPNSSTPLRQGSTPVSRQMTIFYGGQAHVFDDVHPNKADVIMALAGSNGGSWSTSFLPTSSLKPSGGEDISGGSGNMSLKDARGPMLASAEQKSEEKQ